MHFGIKRLIIVVLDAPRFADLEQVYHINPDVIQERTLDLTFQISTLLRYVVDIGKNSPNPKMKTDEREAYQSLAVGLFSCFWTNPWKIAKIMPYMLKDDFFVIET